MTVFRQLIFPDDRVRSWPENYSDVMSASVVREMSSNLFRPTDFLLRCSPSNSILRPALLFALTPNLFSLSYRVYKAGFLSFIYQSLTI